MNRINAHTAFWWGLAVIASSAYTASVALGARTEGDDWATAATAAVVAPVLAGFQGWVRARELRPARDLAIGDVAVVVAALGSPALVFHSPSPLMWTIAVLMHGGLAFVTYAAAFVAAMVSSGAATGKEADR
ncbi:hypothetical protein ABZ752_22815 [Streptomyces roseifaciens]